MVIGVLGKELLDLGAVGGDLLLEHAQHPGAGERQPALGAGEHFPGDELAGPGEDLHAFGKGLRPRQFVAVEELFPFAFAGRLERRRGGKGFQEGPGCRQCPVLEGFEGGRIIFLQSTLELIGQSGAFLDQGHLVAAKQPQLGHQRVFFAQGPPAMAIDPQGIGQTPGIQMVGLIPTGHLALAVSLRAQGRNRIKADSTFQELLDDHALAGLHTDGHGASQDGDLLAPALPAARTVFEGQIGHNLTLPVNDDHLMMSVSPVEAPHNA